MCGKVIVILLVGSPLFESGLDLWRLYIGKYVLCDAAVRISIDTICTYIS
jgi:hypothetical protein